VKAERITVNNRKAVLRRLASCELGRLVIEPPTILLADLFDFEFGRVNDLDLLARRAAPIDHFARWKIQKRFLGSSANAANTRAW
jgi:hypothetical protein